MGAGREDKDQQRSSQRKMSRHLAGRLRLLCAGLALAALCCGCSNISRGSARVFEDAAVVVLAPVQVPVGTLYNTYQSIVAQPSTGILASPLILTTHLLKHAYATAACAFDLTLAPFHLALGSEPMHIYSLNGFPFAVRSPPLRRGTARAIHSARQIIASVGSLPRQVANAAVQASSDVTGYGKLPLMAYRTARRLIITSGKVVLYAADYVVSPIYLPFGPAVLNL